MSQNENANYLKRMAVVYKEQNMVVPHNYISLLKLLVIKIIDTGGEI